MIKLQKMTPRIYYKQSRDFQFIGRLYDMVLNSVKTNTDMIYSLPCSDDMNTEFLDLLAMTLGFKAVHNYNVNQLKSLCSCLAKVIRNKGSATAIEMACNALVGAEGLTDPIYVDYSNNKKEIVLYVSRDLSDINLLRDLLNYILPAGLSYSIVRLLRQDANVSTTVTANSGVKIYTERASKTSRLAQKISDSGTLFAPNLTTTPNMLINSTVISIDKTDSTTTTTETEDTTNE